MLFAASSRGGLRKGRLSFLKAIDLSRAVLLDLVIVSKKVVAISVKVVELPLRDAKLVTLRRKLCPRVLQVDFLVRLGCSLLDHQLGVLFALRSRVLHGFLVVLLR